VDKLEARIWGKIDGHGSEEQDIEAGYTSGEELPEDSEDDNSDEELNSGTVSEELGPDDVEDRSLAVNERDEVGAEEEEDDDDNEEGEGEDGPSQENAVQNIPLPPSSPYLSYAEEQRFLQGADRRLARTLASADANGHGISNDMCMSKYFFFRIFNTKFNLL
jgi:hypothetical protein